MTMFIPVPEIHATEAPIEVLEEQHDCHCSFNVMPGRPVSETLHVREYRTGERYVEAHFDREYQSSMKASPSHLIFLTALVHTQKMLYLALCREFGLDYDPEGEEVLKMWPTKINVKIPTMIAEEEDLVQKLWIRKLRKVDERTYRAVIEVRIGTLQIHSTVPTFLL